MDLLSPITNFPGVGEKTALKLAKLSIFTPYDLLTHIPVRYQDRTRLSFASHCQAGEEVCLKGTLSSIKNQFTKTGRFIQVATFTDSSGSISVIWFNQIYLARNHRNPCEVYLFGKVDFLFGKKITLISPDVELVTPENPIHNLGFIPVYPETAGLTSKWLRNKSRQLLSAILPTNPIPLPPEYPSWQESISQIHYPKSLTGLPQYKNRLEIDELVIHILGGLIQKKERLKKATAPKMSIDQKKLTAFIKSLSFTLTPSQNQSLQEILFDLTRNIPMNRLLEGDVGSGKTIVAAISAFIAHLNGYRTLFLAPTQILATQHHQTLTQFFTPFNIEVGLLTSNSKLQSSNLPIIVGTHSILSKTNIFTQVGLIVIDEQHKFGVLQRNQAAQIGESPHILTMTATPIPRSIALTLYGDLDLSVLYKRENQNDRVKTWLVPEKKRDKSYIWITDQIKNTGIQAFIVCPFIDPTESAASVKSATSEFARLTKIFTHLKLGLLHGRLKSAEKNTVMADFKSKRLDLLVCTPVVEVGIDVPNANIILVEDADRFGLAQLHQLRGRVGRGEKEAYCLLFSSKDTSRLQILTTTYSGLELAEADLKMRGPGQIYGTLQHGFIPFKIASFTKPELIIKAKSIAETLLPDLPEYPLLKKLVEQLKIPGYDTSS